MNISEYIESKRHAMKKIKSDIRERWNNRLVKNSWHLQGVEGAAQYLANYGNNIGIDKVIGFAVCAEQEGYPEVAMGFWQKAFEIETGAAPTPKKPKAAKTSTYAESTVIVEAAPRLVEELPSHLQPGRIVTMQPVDAPFDREYYINSPDYWGQPKRDGNRFVVIATKDQVYYQSRSTNIKAQPAIEINNLLLGLANQIGTFVLDGELYFRSSTGSEHRTAPQAAMVNEQNGQPVVAKPIYAIFKALWFSGQDLTNKSEALRIEAGEEIGKYLDNQYFEVVPTAKTQAEKASLAAKQLSEGREGEIWVSNSCQYTGGKDTRAYVMVRTKYNLELDLIITECTKTTVAGRPFSALNVAQEVNGKLVPIGSVGTGFSQHDMEEIARRHATNPGSVKITVRCQGLTERGKLWHARFIGICEEK
ncbi:DNA ligase [Calothrix sp. NIES-4071]|nr:DNA ligase [Calothrix sp. NIES-4071]BAZ63133.1 DNA ligase [Calothrix sp. NIES-4105]